jgi:hypothetical protein
MFGSELLLVVGGVGLDRIIASGCQDAGTRVLHGGRESYCAQETLESLPPFILYFH